MSSSLRAQLAAPSMLVFDLDALGSAGPLLPARSLEEVSLHLHLTEHSLACLGSSREVARVLGDLMREVALETARGGKVSFYGREHELPPDACFYDAVGSGEDLGAVLALLLVLEQESSSRGKASPLAPSLAARLPSWIARLRALLARMAHALEAQGPVTLDEAAWEDALGTPLGDERGLLRFARPEDAKGWVWRESFLQTCYCSPVQDTFRKSGLALFETVGRPALSPDRLLRAVARDLGMGYQALIHLMDGLARDRQTQGEQLLFRAAAVWCQELLELLQDLGAALEASTPAGPEEAG